jgi:hypothetical protein
MMVLICTVVLGLGGAEIGVRWLGPIPRSELLPLPQALHAAPTLGAEPTGYLRFDTELGWTVATSATNVDDGVVYTSGAGGFRAEREYSVEPPAGVVRVAAFGDSFVHCDEVSLTDCWTSRLERAWRASEILNFGVPGSSADQGWLRYQRDGEPYRPCAVLIGFQVENANRVVNRYRPFYAPGSGIALSKPRFVLDGPGLRLIPNPVTSPDMLDDPAWVEENLGPHDFWYVHGMIAPQPLDSLILFRLARTAVFREQRRQIKEAGPAAAYSPDDERFLVSGRLLVEFARQARAEGATPVVVVFGQRDEVVAARHREPKAYQALLTWLSAAGVPAIDVSDDLGREANRTGVDGLFSRGGHYSPRGNAVVATGLARQLPPLVAPTCQ